MSALLLFSQQVIVDLLMAMEIGNLMATNVINEGNYIQFNQMTNLRPI